MNIERRQSSDEPQKPKSGDPVLPVEGALRWQVINETRKLLGLKNFQGSDFNKFCTNMTKLLGTFERDPLDIYLLSKPLTDTSDPFDPAEIYFQIHNPHIVDPTEFALIRVLREGAIEEVGHGERVDDSLRNKSLQISTIVYQPETYHSYVLEGEEEAVKQDVDTDPMDRNITMPKAQEFCQRLFGLIDQPAKD